MSSWRPTPADRPARFDETTRTLWLTEPWGILCLDAAPVRLRVLDLRREGSPAWHQRLVPLDLARYLALVRSVWPVPKPGESPWWDIERDGPAAPVEPHRVASAGAWRDFFRCVGFGLCETVARYPPVIQGRMLWLGSRVPRLASLAVTNPGLSVALAGRCAPQRRGLDRARRRCDGGERQIAERLGFRPDCRRVLARVHSGAAFPGRLARLRRALESPPVRRVARHLPRLGASTLVLLSRPELFARVQPKLFHELAGSDVDLERPQLARRLQVLIDAERLCDRGSLFGRLGSLGQLQRLCNEWFWGDAADWSVLSRMTFPPPPIEDEPGLIEGIRSPAGLLTESVSMGNCVHRYVDSILARRYYAYRTLGTFGLQRATVLVAPHEAPGQSVVWHIVEARADHNRLCSLPTREALEIFFSGRQRVGEDEVRVRPAPAIDLEV